MCDLLPSGLYQARIIGRRDDSPKLDRTCAGTIVWITVGLATHTYRSINEQDQKPPHIPPPAPKRLPRRDKDGKILQPQKSPQKRPPSK